jgi:hypothetical protein
LTRVKSGVHKQPRAESIGNSLPGDKLVILVTTVTVARIGVVVVLAGEKSSGIGRSEWEIRDINPVLTIHTGDAASIDDLEGADEGVVTAVVDDEVGSTLARHNQITGPLPTIINGGVLDVLHYSSTGCHGAIHECPG